MSPKLPDHTVNTLLPPTTPTTRPVARYTSGTHPAPTPAYHIVQLGLCNDLSGYEYAGSRTTKSHSAKTARITVGVFAGVSRVVLTASATILAQKQPTALLQRGGHTRG